MNYKYLEKVWADNKENNLFIVPSIIEPYYSEIIIHKIGNRKVFFVFGNNPYYTENPKKYEYRKEFIEIVRHEAITNLKRFKVESDYYRKPLFEIEND